MSNIRDLLKKSEMITYTYDQCKKFYYKYMISGENYVKRRFKQRLGRELELENPIKFNDKLQWLKFNWYDPFAQICADKYRVREFVAQKIAREYLNDIYGVYESVRDLDIDKLPSSFVLKCNHGSGFNIICKNKEKVNWKDEFRKLKRWLNRDYYFPNREWVYKGIKPRIICEKYLEEDTGDLKDYKIFCFHGEPKLIIVDVDRFKIRKRNFYDVNWNLMNVTSQFPRENRIIPKPPTLDEMLELSRILSKDFPHVRVDWYSVHNKIIFGELTFFHASGYGIFKPVEFEIEMGSWLDLSKIKNNNGGEFDFSY